MGLEDDVYLIDIIEFEESIPMLKRLFENDNLIKVLWDCRKDFSELWHAHRIHLKPVLDMQLGHIHHKIGAQIGSPGWIKLDSLNYAFEAFRQRTSRV